MEELLDHLRSSVAAACAPIGALHSYFNQYLRRPMRRLFPFLDPFITVDIAASPDDCSYYSEDRRAKSSDAYAEVLAFLSREARVLRAEGAEGAAEGHGFVLSLRDGQEVAHEFRGVTMWWSTVPGHQRSSSSSLGRCCRLTFHQRHWRLVVDEYLPHVCRAGQEVTSSNRPRRLYSNKKGVSYHSRREEVWSYIDFNHPTTFDTLAMDPTKKKMIMDDLDNFRNNKDYYRRVGKAWKRGYLLHGPLGTGKSSMIAAMANYLNYDIYDIKLTTLYTNSDLRKLFIETTSKSIITIEDIDYSLDLTGNRTTKGRQDDQEYNPNMLTLPGLLNFIDGLWSANSGERIIVFTTNYIDELHPALIRRGRMDMHIKMSYCEFEAFKTLAKNYLEVDAHPLFDTVKELLQVAEMAPVDVAECLMASKRTDRDADVYLERLIDELKKKKEENKKKKDQKARKKAKAKAKAKKKADAEKEKIKKETAEDNNNKIDENGEKKAAEVDEEKKAI